LHENYKIIYKNLSRFGTIPLFVRNVPALTIMMIDLQVVPQT